MMAHCAAGSSGDSLGRGDRAGLVERTASRAHQRSSSRSSPTGGPEATVAAASTREPGDLLPEHRALATRR